MTPGLLKPGEFEVGEETWEPGVGRSCGDCSEGSSLGAILEFDRLAW